MDQEKIQGDPDHVGSNLYSYLQALSPAVCDIFERFEFQAQLDRLDKQLDEQSMLTVLRHGIALVGLRQSIKLAQFKPALGMNPDILARYAANRLRVVRQVRSSQCNEKAIDPAQL